MKGQLMFEALAYVGPDLAERSEARTRFPSVWTRLGPVAAMLVLLVGLGTVFFQTIQPLSSAAEEPLTILELTVNGYDYLFVQDDYCYEAAGYHGRTLTQQELQQLRGEPVADVTVRNAYSSDGIRISLPEESQAESLTIDRAFYAVDPAAAQALELTLEETSLIISDADGLHYAYSYGPTTHTVTMNWALYAEDDDLLNVFVQPWLNVLEDGCRFSIQDPLSATEQLQLLPALLLQLETEYGIPSQLLHRIYAEDPTDPDSDYVLSVSSAEHLLAAYADHRTANLDQHPSVQNGTLRVTRAQLEEARQVSRYPVLVDRMLGADTQTLKLYVDVYADPGHTELLDEVVWTIDFGDENHYRVTSIDDMNTVTVQHAPEDFTQIDPIRVAQAMESVFQDPAFTYTGGDPSAEAQLTLFLALLRMEETLGIADGADRQLAWYDGLRYVISPADIQTTLDTYLAKPPVFDPAGLECFDPETGLLLLETLSPKELPYPHLYAVYDTGGSTAYTLDGVRTLRETAGILLYATQSKSQYLGAKVYDLELTHDSIRIRSITAKSVPSDHTETGTLSILGLLYHASPDYYTQQELAEMISGEPLRTLEDGSRVYPFPDASLLEEMDGQPLELIVRHPDGDLELYYTYGDTGGIAYPFQEAVGLSWEELVNIFVTPVEQYAPDQALQLGLGYEESPEELLALFKAILQIEASAGTYGSGTWQALWEYPKIAEGLTYLDVPTADIQVRLNQYLIASPAFDPGSLETYHPEGDFVRMTKRLLDSYDDALRVHYVALQEGCWTDRVLELKVQIYADEAHTQLLAAKTYTLGFTDAGFQYISIERTE